MLKIISSNRSRIIALIEEGSIPANKIATALEVNQLRPSPRDWHSFIDKLLLRLGALVLVFAVRFFIAYNWNDLGRFAKFALAQVFILLAIIIYWK